MRNILLSVIAVFAAPGDAFLPRVKHKSPASVLHSTTEEDQRQPHHWNQTEPELIHPMQHNPQRPGHNIHIAPLGANQARVSPIKEFPTYEMKERFRKIRAPRNTQKSFPKVELPVEKEEEVEEETAAVQNEPVPPLLYGIGEFFDTEKLTQSVRQNADVGKPLESSRSLADALTVAPNTYLSCGSASCTQGGWPSKTPSNATQIFYLLCGFGCLTDMDGMRHYFGPGDTVVVPQNWAGRWDVAEDLHKIWFTLDHGIVDRTEREERDDEKEEDEEEDVVDDDEYDEDLDIVEDPEEQDLEETDDFPLNMIRAKVIHYHELVKWSFPNAMEVASTNDDPLRSETTFYNDGMGLSCLARFSTASVPIAVPPCQQVNCFHILEGTMVLTPAFETDSYCFRRGDTVVLPKGWHGTCEIQDPVKALRVKA